MNYKKLKKKMDIFFKKTPLNNLIKQIEDLGYVVENIEEPKDTPSDLRDAKRPKQIA